jgi:hypothetical protein
MTLLEFDLDHATARAEGAPARPGGRRRPLLLLALVVAALGGALLRTVSFGSSEPPAAPVSAVLSLTDLALAPDPVIGLRLELTATAGDVQVDRLRLGGGGSGNVTLPLGTLLPSGRSSGFDLETPLLCKPLGNPDLTGTVRVRDPGAQLWREVPVVTAGLLHGPGGACGVAANQVLPPGWDAPLEVGAVRAVGPVLTFTVKGLGSLDRVQGVSVDGTILSPAAGNRATGEIAVLAPEPDCTRPDTRPFVPTGVRVLLTGPSGMVTRYAALGPVLAQWLRSARADRCDHRTAPSGGRRMGERVEVGS